MTEEELYERALEIREEVFADELTSTSRVQILNLRLATLQVIALSHIEGWLRSAAESLDSISNDIAGIRDVLDKESN